MRGPLNFLPKDLEHSQSAPARNHSDVQRRLVQKHLLSHADITCLTLQAYIYLLWDHRNLLKHF